METCQNKGQSEADCHNYIMVLQSYGNQLYVCGTNAFSPHCSWRQVISGNTHTHTQMAHTIGLAQF